MYSLFVITGIHFLQTSIYLLMLKVNKKYPHVHVHVCEIYYSIIMDSEALEILSWENL